MDKYKEAESLHLKAIKIKESLLGNEDSEVAVSLGHLASLYNYDMEGRDINILQLFVQFAYKNSDYKDNIQ